MNKVIIIAEAGVNHNGDIELAYKLIEKAKEAGADYVKFQTSLTSTSKFSKKAEYAMTNESETQLEMLEKLRFSFSQHLLLKKYCDKIGIKYLSTPFDYESMDFLENIVDVWKIPSGEVVNYPYLIKIARTNKPIIMSTGICTLEEVKQAVKILTQNGAKDIVLLHCTTNYPTDYSDVNLKAMITLKKSFDVEVGYSDHTLGIEVPIAAVAMGATVIEKHFTLDRNLPGPDHKASLEPDELKKMVNSIRKIEQALGDGKKEPKESELKNAYAARKSLVALRKIRKGESFTSENIIPRHAGIGGILPNQWFEVLGKKAIRDFEEDEMIEL